MDEGLTAPSTFELKFSKQIYCVELSPYEWSQNLICIALAEEIVIGTIKFQEEDETVEDFAYSRYRTFSHNTRPHAIAWSPETCLTVVSKLLTFCVAGADFKIRLYCSNTSDSTIWEMEGHKDYVNSICYESEGKILASVSDDHTCKLWAVNEEGRCISTMYLTSPGMSIHFHTEKPNKLLVGEKNGLIHMYDIQSQQAIMSLDTDFVPLMSIDWGSNPSKIAAIAAGKLLIWDISKFSLPQKSRPSRIEGGLIVRFSPAYDHLVATIEKPDNLLKVRNLKSCQETLLVATIEKPNTLVNLRNLKSYQEILCGQLKLIGGITWHYKLPYICAASDREIRFWRVSAS